MANPLANLPKVKLTPERARQLAEGEISPAEFLGLDQKSMYEIAKTGHAMLKSGNYAGALDIFQGLVAAAPTDSVFHTHLAATWANIGKYDEALAEYDAAVRYNVANVDAVAGRGELLLRVNRVEEALRDFNQALALDPECRRVSAHRARTMVTLLTRGVDAVAKAEPAPEPEPAVKAEPITKTATGTKQAALSRPEPISKAPTGSKTAAPAKAEPTKGASGSKAAPAKAEPISKTATGNKPAAPRSR